MQSSRGRILLFLVSVFCMVFGAAAEAEAAAAAVACSSGECKLGDRCSSEDDCGSELYCYNCWLEFAGRKCVRTTVANPFEIVTGPSTQLHMFLFIFLLLRTPRCRSTEWRPGTDAGRLRLPRRRLAVPLQRREMLRFHRVRAGDRDAARGGGVPVVEPIGDRDADPGRLRAGRPRPVEAVPGRRPRQVLVPRVADAAARRGLAARPRHGGAEPPPPRVHLGPGEAGHRRDRVPVGLHGGEPVWRRRDALGLVRQPVGVGGARRRGEVAGAGELLPHGADRRDGVLGALAWTDGHAPDLPRRRGRPLGQLRGRRLLPEERRRRVRGYGHAQRDAHLRPRRRA